MSEVRVFIDETLFATLNSAPYTADLDSTELSDGEHTIRAEAEDAAGNIGTSSTVSFSVDNAPPPDVEVNLISK